MSKTKGSKNFYQGSKYYTLNSLLAYFQKQFPKIKYPQSWETGGGLNDLVRKLGYVPEIDNGIPGRGHMTKFKGTTMQEIAKSVRNYLKDTTPKKPRLTPIEVANKEARKREEQAPVIVLDPTPEQKPEPVEESAPISEEVKIPKGFIVFHDLSNDFFMISVSSIFFVEDYGDGRANVFWSGPDGNEHLSTVKESFAEVLNLISKALEV